MLKQRSKMNPFLPSLKLHLLQYAVLEVISTGLPRLQKWRWDFFTLTYTDL